MGSSANPMRLMTSRARSRALAVGIGLAVGLSLVGGAWLTLGGTGTPQRWNGPISLGLLQTPEAKRLAEDAVPRQARLLAELSEPGLPPWAGSYRSAGRYPLRMVIAPREGFTLHEQSGCGNCTGWSATGRVVEAAGEVLTLGVELGCWGESYSDARWWCRSSTLHMVSWGDLLFAVPAALLERFHLDVGDGYSFPDVPVRVLPGAESDFDYDAPTRPVGRPEPVAGFEHLLLAEPLEARILELVAWNSRSESEDRVQYHDATWTIDAGSAQGLAPGMRLYLGGGTDLGGRPVTVEAVEPHTARVTRIVDVAHDLAAGLEGSSITSLHPRATRPPG